jgi:broad specificity phosphatase PhoE
MNEFSGASYKLVRMKPIIYIVRHGETTLNAGNKFRGFADVPLDENGIKQADQVRDDLSDVNLSHSYSSDLQRAEKTANIIIKPHGISNKILKDMRPWDVGKFTGQPKNAENKKELQAFADTPDKAIPDGESLNQFRDRYTRAFNQIVDEARASVFSGGGASLMAQHASNCHEVGNIVYGDIDVLDIDPGGIIIISWSPSGISASIFKGAANNNERDTVS